MDESITWTSPGYSRTRRDIDVASVVSPVSRTKFQQETTIEILHPRSKTWEGGLKHTLQHGRWETTTLLTGSRPNSTWQSHRGCHRQTSNATLRRHHEIREGQNSRLRAASYHAECWDQLKHWPNLLPRLNNKTETKLTGLPFIQSRTMLLGSTNESGCADYTTHKRTMNDESVWLKHACTVRTRDRCW